MKPEVVKAIPRSSVIKRIVIYVGIGLLLSWVVTGVIGWTAFRHASELP